MNYPHTLVITRASDSGSIDPATGKWTASGDPVSVYNGAVDAQEQGGGGLSVGGADLKTVRADLAIYLKDESVIAGFKIGDTGQLTRGSNSQQVIIRKVRYLDGMIEADIDQ